MHNIRYNYTDTTKNRLSGIFATGLNSGTYQYDALGNMVRDNAEGLTVGWNALDKVDTIRRNGNILSMFRYSPTGQRQVKATSSDTTFYIHDATGNVMCVYRLKNDTLTASERYIYGSKRLGMLGQQVWITAGGAARLQDRNTIGHRLYELTDHLGNVTTTLPDRKYITPNADNEPIYIPDAVTYTDYYPFGFPMPRPGFTTGGYRYFFNGQEADNEVLGEGGFQNYGFRMYDTRIARFWGVDPLTKNYPMLTPFQFASCSPVWGVDIDGLEVRVYVETPQYLHGNVGHVFLSVGSGDNIIAYSYGRYGELGKNKGSLNSLNRRGEGVLYRYVGDDATNYIRKNLFNYNAYAFEINGVDESDVRWWFDILYYSKGERSSSDKLKDVTNAKVIDLYDLLSNNCTTKTIDALRAGGSKESFKNTKTMVVPSTGLGKPATIEDNVNTPDEMFGYLFMRSTNGSTIKNITKELKEEYGK